MDDENRLKRFLLPPLIALPIVVGFLFIVVGLPTPTGGTDVAESPDFTLIYIGLAILVGNGVFWPLLFHRRGKRKREQKKREAQRKANKARNPDEEE